MSAPSPSTLRDAYRILVQLDDSQLHRAAAKALTDALNRDEEIGIGAAILRAELATKDFNPHERRDYHGRWTDGGGGIAGPTSVGRKPRFWPERGQWAIRRLRADNPSGLHVEDDNSDKVQSAVFDYYRLPSQVRQVMELSSELAHGRDYIAVNDKTLADFPDFAATHSADDHPRGWPRGSTWKNPRGVYSRKLGKVFVAGDGTTDGSRSVMIHEIGHMIQNTLEFRRDLSPHFLDELNAHHKRLYDKLTPYEQQDGPGSVAGCEETFAEAVAEVVVADSYSREAAARQRRKVAEMFDAEFTKWIRKQLRAYGKAL